MSFLQARQRIYSFGNNSSTVTCILRAAKCTGLNSATNHTSSAEYDNPCQLVRHTPPPALHVNPFKLDVALLSIDISLSWQPYLSLCPVSDLCRAKLRFPIHPMDNDFDSVSWQNDPDIDSSKPTMGGASQPEENTSGAKSSGKRRANRTSAQAGPDADAVDLAGIGEGRLDCTVNTPLKENDGTKDAYISYLVTTTVRICRVKHPRAHRLSYQSCNS